jgi:exopolyphosphatase/guanosine-5'-triphosphate,3'-diphosphate pyrophosphatase
MTIERSPRHFEELAEWTDKIMVAYGLDETGDEKRLRRASCHLADIGRWAHPDYRGEQSLNFICNAARNAIRAAIGDGVVMNLSLWIP